MLTHGAVHALELCGSAAQKAAVSAEDGERGVDRHHGAHRAAGGLGSRPGAHARGARGRITTGSSGRRSSSPGAITISPPTPSTWCSGASRARRAGVKGISLFIVPKFLVNADGSLGARNEVRCLSIEHKLGIHASPTCVLAFGERDGAIAHLVGRAGARPRVHVRHDEQRAPVGGERGLRGRRARLPARGCSGRAPACRAGRRCPRRQGPRRSSITRTSSACCSR